jgi:hypothetical protein
MIWFGIFQAADYLEQAEYNTGNPEDDLKTESLVKQLLYNSKLRSACPLPFDEAKLWQGENGPELKQEIQKQFRNIRFVTYFWCSYFIRCIWTTCILTHVTFSWLVQLWTVLDARSADCGESSKFLALELLWKFFSLLMEIAIWISRYVVHLSNTHSCHIMIWEIYAVNFVGICSKTVCFETLSIYPHFKFLTLNSSWCLTFPLDKIMVSWLGVLLQKCFNWPQFFSLK